MFGSADIGLLDWLKVLTAGLLVFVVAELEKFLIRRMFWIGRLDRASRQY